MLRSLFLLSFHSEDFYWLLFLNPDIYFSFVQLLKSCFLGLWKLIYSYQICFFCPLSSSYLLTVFTLYLQVSAWYHLFFFKCFGTNIFMKPTPLKNDSNIWIEIPRAVSNWIGYSNSLDICNFLQKPNKLKTLNRFILK